MMSQENLIENTLSTARFEFRCFGQDFEKAAMRMARLSVPVPENLWDRLSDETYIISGNCETANAKIRDGKLEIKELIRVMDGLEQWYPILETAFPINRALLESKVFSALEVRPPQLTEEIYSCESLLHLVNQHQLLQPVNVRKRRSAYMVYDTICETGCILVNGARVMTISSESVNVENVKKTIKEIGLEGKENINYLQAIKRIVGMSSKPLIN